MSSDKHGVHMSREIPVACHLLVIEYITNYYFEIF